MQVDFSKIVRDVYGNMERPTLILKKPHDEIIGPLTRAFNLSMELKYSDVSTAKFDYPFMDSGIEMPFYGDIVKDKLVEISPFGVFIVDTVDDTTDGIQKKITVELKSREHELGGKHFSLGAGVYRLCLPRNGEVSGSQEDTLMGYILEAAPGWSIGYVSPALYTKYKKMPVIDEQVLDFLQGTVQDSYGCVVVFDSYSRTISLIDVDETVPRLPIYLSYDNLLSNGTVKQLSEPVTTKLFVQGADGVDIRDVNPTGDSYIYNLDWYIERGDLPEALSQKWIEWQNALFLQQPIHSASIEARNTLAAQKLTAEADLTELKNDKASETNLLDASVSAKALAKTDDIDYDAQITEHQDNIDAIDKKIVAQEEAIKNLQSQIDSINTGLIATKNRLRVTSYFTSEELTILNCYFKEGSFQDSTFAVSDVSGGTGAVYLTAESAQLNWDEATIDVVKKDSNSTIALVVDGKLNITGMQNADGTSLSLSSECVVNATIQTSGTSLTATIYAAPFVCGDTKYNQCTITMTATVSDSDNMFAGMVDTEIAESSYDDTLVNSYIEYTGSCSIALSNVAMYTTQSATDYQKYSVQQDLYEYAEKYLIEQAYPLCEFEVSSANFFVAPGYEVFKDRLQLGCGCYLDLDDSLMLHPTLIEVHIDFDDNEMQLVFSNSFRRRGDVERLKDVIRDTSSASRSYESMRNQYGITNDYTSWVHNLLTGGLDAAKTQILAGVDNTVTADGTGLTVDSQSGDTCIRLNNGMIALFDKKSNTVKMAMGRFYNEARKEDYVGVLADVIGGTLLAGKNLIIECPGEDGGVMQFKVDSTGVVVNNGRWHMQSDQGCVAIDPKYGFMAGTSSLFKLSDTGKISPTCVDKKGELILDKDGFPKDINVWIGIDGTVYLRGTVYADAGYFNGIVQATDFLDHKGNSMMTAAGKINSGYLDLMGLEIKNKAGQVVLKITEDGIEFMSSGGSSDTGNYEGRIADLEDTVGGWQYRGGTKIDGSMIKAGTVMASSLQGGEIVLLDKDEDEAGCITIEDASSADHAIRLASGGSLSLAAEKGDVYIEGQATSGAKYYIAIDTEDSGVGPSVSSNIHIRPSLNNSYDLGLSSFKWNDVYATNCPATTSDATHKRDIVYDMSAMDSFYDSLQPATYKFRDGQSGRTHTGFIAQDVEQSLIDNGMTSMDFAGLIKSPRGYEDGYDYALRYSEFIALNTWQIQRMKARIDELEAKLAALTNN